MNFIKAQNEITVTVKTNVNSFNCTINNAWLTSNTNNSKTTIVIPVKSFRCPKRMIEKDIQEIFEAEKFPNITLSVDSPNKNNNSVKTQITIKNIQKNYNVKMTQNHSTIHGNLTISLNDFGIDPPTKMMGTVKVKDDVKIYFKLNETLINHP